MVRRVVYIVLLIPGIWSCTNSQDAEPASVPSTALNLRVQDSLRLLQDDFESLRLWEALARGRRLRPWMEANRDSVAPELIAEVYQRLAMLHFDREVVLDSVEYFTAASDKLITKGHPAVLRARQALCWAYFSYHDHAMREMELYARLGLAVLPEKEGRHSYLRASLLTALGRAAKQLGDRMATDAERRSAWSKSQRYFTEGATYFTLARSPRILQAYEELGILLSRIPEQQGEIYSMVDRMIAARRSSPVTHYDPARLLGYYHRRRGDIDSAIYYYERVIQESSTFFNGYFLEGAFTLRQSYEDVGRFDDALAVSDTIMYYYGCCPVESTTKRSEQYCSVDPRCAFALSHHAEIHRHFFGESARRSDLATALLNSQSALQRYRMAFDRASNEGVLNQIVIHGDYIISTSIATAFTYYRLFDRTTNAAQAIFNAIEMGKSHSLAEELIEHERYSSSRDELDVLMQRERTKGEIDLIKGRAAAGENLSTDVLEDFSHYLRSRRALTQRLDSVELETDDANTVAYGPPAVLKSVQRKLTKEEAIIEFIETEDLAYGLFIDSDTVIAYTVDTSFRSHIDAFRGLVRNRTSNLDSLYTLGEEVYNLLFSGVADIMHRRLHLKVAPSASMYALPFAVLRTSDSAVASYLIDLHSIQYIDSWRTFELEQNRSALFVDARSKVGVWTNPELEHYLGGLADQLGKYDRLQLTRHGTVDISSANLLKEAKQYDWIHLSVHASGNPFRLNDNYLYLNRKDSINGIQIGMLDLSCSMVVLAACSTGVGAIVQREGTYSLRRSFHRAGVPIVVSSHFDIPASSSSALLAVFYEQVLAGSSPAGSLREAQLRALRGELNPRWSHPAYWAGLIVG